MLFIVEIFTWFHFTREFQKFIFLFPTTPAADLASSIDFVSQSFKYLSPTISYCSGVDSGSCFVVFIPSSENLPFDCSSTVSISTGLILLVASLSGDFAIWSFIFGCSNLVLSLFTLKIFVFPYQSSWSGSWGRLVSSVLLL